MTIRCITFDLDDTLWACQPVIAAAERRFYAWLIERYPALGVPFHDLDALIAHRIAYFRRNADLRHDMTRLRKRWLAELAAEHALDDALIEDGFRVFWLARNEVELYAEAADLLCTLGQRFTIGAITNGNADVRHIGVDHYFDFVLTSAEAGVSKPHPDIFAQALARAGVSANECVHVGDDAECDVRGAQALGLRAVWVNPAQSRWPLEEGAPDASIRHVSELPGVLREWNAL
ncbi:HAD family hydrolase [Acidihalobacter ferrooxydans]|uniref:Haloacid dehalogenase n=1 Tax=Acidihalobacter ferrooxydans TaxID=1765967 RepID=A0A1P8UH61_9GAMM|nr:HAD family hydrolase [Acidihalobacter ferrooxydans]APZ43175.1 haloacid dehalogenase [Acidihalobacter ferrooxydans]